MAFLQPNNKPNLLKRPSDGDIGGDLRNRDKHLERSAEISMLRDLYPDCDPTTAKKLNETQSAIDGWFVMVEKLGQTQDTWEAQCIVNELFKSINNSGFDLSKMERERNEFDRNKRIVQMMESSQTQSTRVKQDRLFNFDLLLEKFKQLRNTVEESGTQLLRKGHCKIEHIMAKLEEARSAIPDAASSQGLFTHFDSRAMDVPAHKRDRINPNVELEKHPSRPDAIKSKTERGKAELDKLECATSSLLTMTAVKEPENDKNAVVLWKHIANSLSTMQPIKLELDGKSETDILILAMDYMSKRQPDHGGERALPGIDYIRCQNDETELGFNTVPLQQMERLLSGIPDAQVVAFFILSHLPEEHHALLSSTTMFTEERDVVWRGHFLVGKWSEEEREAFAFEFTRLVRGTRTIKSVLQKWRGLIEVSLVGFPKMPPTRTAGACWFGVGRLGDSMVAMWRGGDDGDGVESGREVAQGEEEGRRGLRPEGASDVTTGRKVLHAGSLRKLGRWRRLCRGGGSWILAVWMKSLRVAAKVGKRSDRAAESASGIIVSWSESGFVRTATVCLWAAAKEGYAVADSDVLPLF
ncbi:hypothetical protein V492_00641 [Pseudogymnoascus sp. VKM F-4246]|nr:hypothetical protein V492_00641 [Pseudogymnoascus sp. VKM F-4246]